MHADAQKDAMQFVSQILEARGEPMDEDELLLAYDELHEMLVSEALLQMWRENTIEPSFENGEIHWRLTTSGLAGTIIPSQGQVRPEANDTAQT